MFLLVTWVILLHCCDLFGAETASDMNRRNSCSGSTGESSELKAPPHADLVVFQSWDCYIFHEASRCLFVFVFDTCMCVWVGVGVLRVCVCV